MRKIKRTPSKKTYKWLSALLVLAIGGIIYLIYTGYIHHKIQQVTAWYHDTTAQIGFVVDDVVIEGNHLTSHKDIQKAIGHLEKRPMATIDIHDLHDRLARLPWVKQVTVQRILPNMISIIVTEKRPIALYQDKKDYFPLDENGKIVPTTLKGLDPHLIVVAGKNAPDKTPRLLAILDRFKLIRPYVLSARYRRDQRWDLYLRATGKDQILVQLPAQKEEQALQRLQKAHETDRILDRNLAEIDLRLNDRIRVKMANEAPLKKQRKK